MKKAVVFYGSMRELEIGSKCWHVLGEDVDYFLVTWDRVNIPKTDPIESYPFDLSSFPVPVKASIIVNYDKHVEDLKNKGIMPAGMLCLMYHWSLIHSLPEISSYDTIIISRTDAASFKLFGHDWNPKVVPGKISIGGNHETGVNDWLLVTDPSGLKILHDLYHNGLSTGDMFDENGQLKIIHSYLLEKIKDNPDQYDFPFAAPVQVLIRTNYPPEWKTLPYGPDLAKKLIAHAIKFEYVYANAALNFKETVDGIFSCTGGWD